MLYFSTEMKRSKKKFLFTAGRNNLITGFPAVSYDLLINFAILNNCKHRDFTAGPNTCLARTLLYYLQIKTDYQFAY